MTKLVPVLVLAALTLPSIAATPKDAGPQKITVAQLEQTLSAAQSVPDGELAQQIAGLDLTERLSSAKLARFQSALPGEKARQALLALADRSVFLDPPAEDIPANPVPDAAALRQMMVLVVDYVNRAVHKLPDFLAVRATTGFEDRPREDVQGATGVTTLSYQPLHVTGKSSIGVVYRDGREQVDSAAGKAAKGQSPIQGLVTSGEFGPILSVVLVDAVKGTITWSRWEQSSNGLLAVYHYAVPREKSHYIVQFCCVQDEGVTTIDPIPFHEITAFHGEIAFDPANGKVMRITAEAELPPSEVVARAAIQVEYGPVEIGGVTYNCPQRSVSILLAHTAPHPGGMYSAATFKGPAKTFLNDVAFVQYHVFGSEARILAGDYKEPASSSAH
jgi:hypothetical protein